MVDNESKSGIQQVPPPFRAWLCGTFRIERYDEGTYRSIRTQEWGGSSYPRLLLKALLCCPGRRARREALLEMLWPESDPDQAVQYINTATTKLRNALRPAKGQESLLITEEDSTLYRLEGQALLWTDVDTALGILSKAEQVGRTSFSALSLLEQATEYFGHGVLLEEEGGLWVTSRRATIERVRYRCRLWLAEASMHHGRVGQAETVFCFLLEEDPLDEDVVCRLMELFHQQGMTHQALRLYNQTCSLLQKDGLEPSEALKGIAERFRSAKQSPVYNPQHFCIDWGEAPSSDQFYGREKEIMTMTSWILEERCRVAAIFGMGGIGKTSFAVTLVERVKDAFEYVFWRSLQHAPFVETLLQEGLKFFASQEQLDIPETLSEQLSLLIHFFRGHRCLFVLDNCETVLQSGSGNSAYRVGYEGYGEVFQRLGATPHQSCLLLTSREEINELSHFQGNQATTHSLLLPGVGLSDGREILKNKGILGSDEEYSQLIRFYSGNPLALKLVAEPIRSVFHGDVAKFLEEDYGVVGGMQDLLAQQFARLSSQEQALLYWLAVEREPISLDALWEGIVSFSSKKELFRTLTSLMRRSLVNASTREGITLQPVIMEYVTDTFIQQIDEELCADRLNLFSSHALIKAQSKEYIRETQMRLILAPLGERLLSRYGRDSCELSLKAVLLRLHQEVPLKPSYAAGNLLNLLVSLRYDLRGYDFSQMQVRQAFLQGIQLFNVNFAFSDLSTSLFTDTFGSIFAVAFHDAHHILAAGTASGEVRVWNTVSGMPLHTWHGHTDWVRSIAFSPDGRILASGSEDQTIRLWDVESGSCLRILEGHQNRVRSVAFSFNGRYVASGSEDKTVRLWDVSTGECLKRIEGHTDQVRAVLFHPHGTAIASGSEDGTIRLWDVEGGNCLRSFDAHVGPVFSLAFHPDGGVLACSGNEQGVRLWDVESGNCLQLLQGQSKRIRSVAFNSEGTLLASGSEDHTVCLWEIETGRVLRSFRGHANSVFSVAFNSDGSIVASGSEDQTIRLWDSVTGQCLRTFRGYTDQIRALAFSPDGKTIASGNEDQTIKLWSVHDGKLRSILRGHRSRIRAVAFSPDGTFLVSGSEDQTVKLWSIAEGQCLGTLEGHTNRVRSVTCSPDKMLVASGSEDHTVRLWDAKTGRCLKTLQGHTNRVRSVAFSPDSTLLASSSEDLTIRLWDVSTGHCLKILQEGDSWIWSITFSPDGALVAGGCEDHTVRIWDVDTDHCLHVLEGHTDRVRSVSFSPDGTTVASGSEDQTVRLWNVHSGEGGRTLRGHEGWVWAVAFSPEGRTVAGGGHDGTLKIWDAQTGACLSTLRSSRPYERMNITGAQGLTSAQQSMLRVLGAFEAGNGSFSGELSTPE